MDVLTNLMGSDISWFEIDHCHRLGKKSNHSNHRPILVKCLSRWRKNEIMGKIRNLKGSKIHIEHDLTKAEILRRKERVPEMLEARSQGKFAVLKRDQLIMIQEEEYEKINNVTTCNHSKENAKPDERKLETGNQNDVTSTVKTIHTEVEMKEVHSTGEPHKKIRKRKPTSKRGIPKNKSTKHKKKSTKK